MKKFGNFPYFFLIISNKLPNYYIFDKNFGGPGPPPLPQSTAVKILGARAPPGPGPPMNVGFSRYPYFIPNFYGELSIALNLPLRSLSRERIWLQNLSYCSGCETVTRELVALAYFSACLRRSLVTLTASAVSTCVGDRLTAAFRLAQSQLNLRGDSPDPVQHVGSRIYGSAFCLRAGHSTQRTRKRWAWAVN